jgi:type I restriction enzyme S subunit
MPLKRVGSKSLLEDGDVVFVDASEDDEGTSRHVVVVNKDKKPFISGLHTIVAKSKTDELVHEYRRYCFQTAIIRQQFLFYAVGTKVSGISKTNIAKLKLAVPTLPEQRAIATALSDLDGLLSGLDQLIAKKRDLKQAAMQQLLTGQTRLPGFHGEWAMRRLGDVATFCKGKGLPKSALSESGAEQCIHYGELFTRYPETIGEIFSRTDTSEGVFRSVANDVLMPTSDVTPRGLAKASCVRVDGVILGGDILVIRSDIYLVHGPFLSRVIRYEETQVLQLVTGSTVYHLYGSDMKNFAFSMPTLGEQTAIAEVLTEMDMELAALEQRREKTCALKQAMMQELLTGRIRLAGKN